MLGKRSDGRWAAFEAALVLPRQNGKGGILECLELFWLVAAEDRLITHTAHRFDTCQEHFGRVASLFDNTPSLSKLLERNGIRTANGSESIRLKDGSRLNFKARSKGSGRGFSGDKLILDEAYYLFDMAAVLPTLSARPNPMVVYASSSPVPGDESDLLRKLCSQGRGDADDSLAYFEWSCPADADYDDPDSWAQSNPAYGIRIFDDFIEVERNRMTDDEFARERLGIWSEDADTAGAIDMAAWNDGAVEQADETWLSDPVCFGVEGNAAGDCFTVIAAGHTAGGKVGLDVVRHDYGTDWLLAWAIEADAVHHPKAWVFDPKSSTADLFMADFRAAGLTVVECGFTDRALPRATAGLYDDITNKRVEHLSHPVLDGAAEGAMWRYVGESRLWDRKAGVALAPLVAATLARFGLVEDTPPAPAPFLIRR